MIIQPRIRGFICTTTHPTGCAAHVQSQIDHVKSKGPIANGPKKVLVVGASTGYGLASRIVPAFASGASTIGVFFEKPPGRGKPGTAGWYNSAAFEEAAKKEGLYAKSFNGDAFSDEVKAQVIEAIKADLRQVDLVVYSLASPVRVDPKTGEKHRSVLKPIGQTYTNKTLNTDKKEVEEVTIEPANDEEIANTIKVMGGEDWEFWMQALKDADALAPGAQSVAYSYIGPELTWPIYKNGTIGKAKEDLEESARKITSLLDGGNAYVSINKALVTQASSAIPVVPLYISMLYKIMKAKGTHEGCIEQMQRLFADRLYSGNPLELDEKGRIRVDDWEMRDEVQSEIAKIWGEVNTDNLGDLTDFDGYQSEFLKLFGFGWDGVDYDAEVDVDVAIPSIS